ncbi:MAG: hypothetical protein ACHP8A_12305 [Terriglobales bacterium]
MDILRALIELGIIALVAGLGGYFGSYLKKKGENLATHEDIGKVLDEVRAVTTTTKEIEAKISNEMWDRQKRWELKREILFEATKKLSSIENGLLSFHTFLRTKKSGGKGDDDPTWIRLEHGYVTQWQDVSKSFQEAEALVNISYSRELMSAFAEVGDLIRATAGKIAGGDQEIYAKTEVERNKKFIMAKVAIRKELGIGFNLTPQ